MLKLGGLPCKTYESIHRSRDLHEIFLKDLFLSRTVQEHVHGAMRGHILRVTCTRVRLE